MNNIGKQNIFLDTLKILKVKHTFKYSDRFYKEHPYKNSFYGLSQMLSEYKIANGGTKIDSKKENLSNIEVPFIAQVGGNFVLVYKIDQKNVYYIWEGIKFVVNFDAFCDSWSGYTLLMEKTPNSCEPRYDNHKREERISSIKKILVLLSTFFIFIYTASWQHVLTNMHFLLSLFLNIIGAYFCHLIITKKIIYL